MAPRKYTKKPVARKPRAPARRRRAVRRSTNVAEWASLSEVRSFSASTFNTLYSCMTLSLDQFERAPIVAQAYQHFRMKSVKITWKPPYDNYASTASTGYGKPNFYYMIDKAGAIPALITLEGLKGMGAKPRALDEKPITVTYSPSVLNSVLTSGGPTATSQGSAYKVSPWLNTNANSVDTVWNASTVDHLGCYWYIDAPQFSGNAPTATVEIEVQFEFKKPLVPRSTGTIAAVPVQMAVLDNSPDGIEGGNDGITLHAH